MHDWNFTDRKMTDLGIGSPEQLSVRDKLIILVARTAWELSPQSTSEEFP